MRTFLQRAKTWVSVVFMLAALGHMAFAGGGKDTSLKGRIQEKLSKSNNLQYEPYYSQSADASQIQQEQVMMAQDAYDPSTVNFAARRLDAVQAPNAQAPGIIADEKDYKKRITCEPNKPTAPSSYAIYNMKYAAELEENVVTVKGDIVFEVFGNGVTQLPLVSDDVGLIDVRVNKGASFVTSQNGKYTLIMHKPGRYTLDFEFLIKASRERERGPGSFNLDVIPAPISQFEFSIPEKDTQIFVEPAIKVETKSEGNKTSAWAVLPNTNAINVRWTKALPKEEIVSVKLDPKIYAETSTYSSIGGGVIRSQTNLQYSILQAEVSSLRVALPEDVTVLEVNGQDLRDWKVSTKENTQYLDVFLNFGVKGSYNLNVTYEKNIPDGSGIAQMPWVKAIGAERENGYYGIAANTNVELALKSSDKVTVIDTKQLPATIWSSSTSPILLAFKYLNPPFDITIEMTRHEELPVLVAAIDSAENMSLYTKEGKILTKATYQVRNNVKQFLRIDLPAKSKIWSAFVAGKPVKPAMDKQGHVLIPLEKSQLQGRDLTQFPVEIVFLTEGTAIKSWGAIKMNLPKVDVPINEFYWSMFLPFDYAYFNFNGDVRLLEKYRPSPSKARSLQGRFKQSADDIGDQFSFGSAAITNFREAKAKEDIFFKGVLPITVNIPQQGAYYRFSKLLVTEGESPWLSMSYSFAFPKVVGFIKLVIFISGLVLLFAFLKKITRKKA